MTALDRKSTRLNSSHSQISYAVFCLKHYVDHLDLHSFPTRRSSDLGWLRFQGFYGDLVKCFRTNVRSVRPDDRPAIQRKVLKVVQVLERFKERITLDPFGKVDDRSRSEEHTSELQSQSNLVCRLLLETLRRSPRSTLFPYTTLFRSRLAAIPGILWRSCEVFPDQRPLRSARRPSSHPTKSS